MTILCWLISSPLLAQTTAIHLAPSAAITIDEQPKKTKTFAGNDWNTTTEQIELPVPSIILPNMTFTAASLLPATYHTGGITLELNPILTNSTPTITKILTEDSRLMAQPYVKNGGLDFGVSVRGLNINQAYVNELQDISRLYQRDSSTLESVHIVQGASGLTHSSNSLGGYINQTLKSPQDDDNFGLVSQSIIYQPNSFVDGIDNSLSTRFTHDINLSKPLSASNDTTMALRASGAWQQGENESGLSKDQHAELFGIQLKHRADNGSHTLNVWSDHQRSQIPFDFGTVISEDKVRYNRNFTDAHQPINRQYDRWQTHYDWLGDAWRLDADYARSRVARQEQLKGFWVKLNEQQLKGYETQIQDDYTQEDARIAAKLTHDITVLGQDNTVLYTVVWQAHQHDYTLSGEQSIDGFRIDLADANWDWTNAASDPDSFSSRLKKEDYRNRSLGYDVQIFDADDTYHLQAGVRRTHFDIRQQPHPTIALRQVAEGDHTNNHFSMTKRWGKHWSTSFSHSQSSAPNLAMAKDGTFLDSKRVRQNDFEINYRQNKAAAALGLFRQDLDNLIQRDPSDRNFFILKGDATVVGGTLSATLPVTTQLSLKTDYQHLKTKDQFGNEFSGLAKHRYQLDMTYAAHPKPYPIEFTWSNQYLSDHCLPNSWAKKGVCVAPSLISSATMHSKVNAHLSAFAQVHNLFNKKTVTDLSSENSVYVAPPRTFILGATYRF